MMLWLLLSVAMAQEDTGRPLRPADAPDDCRAVLALPAGETAPCDAVAVPPASWSHAVAMYSYADRLEVERDTARAQVAVAEADVMDMAVQLDEARKAARRARWEGAAWAGGSIVAGVLVSMGTAWALSQVAQ